MGYGWFYIDYEESAERLQAVLSEHPTWYIPRAVLAIAWSHAARCEWTHNDNQDGDKYAEDALEEIEAPLVLSGDNPFVLTCCFYVYQTAAEFMEDDRETNQLQAQELAKRLSRDHSDYAKRLSTACGVCPTGTRK